MERIGGWVLRHPALALYALAVAVRIPIAVATRTVGVDEAIMAGYGSSWLRTGVDSGIHWPVSYPLLSAGLGSLIGGRLAVELIFVLVGASAVVPLHAGLRALRGDAAALWGAALVALLPAFGAVINKSGSHSLLLPLLGLAFWLHVRALESARPARLLLLGATLGLAYVTRTEGIVFLAVVAASLAVSGWRERRGSPGALEGLRRGALVVAGALVLVVPNVVHVHHHSGRWALSAFVGTMLTRPVYISGLSDERLRAMNEELEAGQGSAAARLLARPAYLARKLAYNGRQLLKVLGDVHVFPVLLWPLLGLTLASFATDWRRGAMVLATWCVPCLAFLPLNIEARYFSPLAVVLALFAGEGWVRLRELLEGGGLRRTARLVPWLVAAFLLALTALTTAVSREGDALAAQAEARVLAATGRERLAETLVLDPELRFAVEELTGAPTAPLTEECCSRYYVVDAAGPQDQQRRRLSAVRKEGGLTLVESAGGIEVWERTGD